MPGSSMSYIDLNNASRNAKCVAVNIFVATENFHADWKTAWQIHVLNFDNKRQTNVDKFCYFDDTE